MSYDPSEQDLVIRVFAQMMRAATKDGGVKRARGEKPPWWCDPAHEVAIFSHLNKWKHGELVDEDSGSHPLVHLAWRALAIAYQEIYGKVDPAPEYMQRLLGLLPTPPPAPQQVDQIQIEGRDLRKESWFDADWAGGANTPGHPDYLGPF